MKKIAHILLSMTIIAFLLVFGLSKLLKSSHALNEMSGVYDGVNWHISTDGILTIGKAGETQTFENKDRYDWGFPWYSNRRNIKQVVVIGKVKAQGSLQGMFNEFSNATDFDLTNLTTSGVNNMSYMFNECNKVTSLDLSSFDTSMVTDVKYMFCNCSNLKSLNISNFDTSNIYQRNWSMTFSNVNLNDITIGTKTDLSNVSSEKNYGYSKTKSKDDYVYGLKNLNSAGTWYQVCESSDLKHGIIGGTCWRINEDDELVIGTDGETQTFSHNYEMYSGNDAYHFYSYLIKKIKFVGNVVADETIEYAFAGLHNIEDFDSHNFDTSNVKKMTHLFSKLKYITELDLSGFNTEKVTDMSYIFSEMSNLRKLNISSFDTGNVTSLYGMFSKTPSLEEITIGNNTRLDIGYTDTNNVTWAKDKSMLQIVKGIYNINSSGTWYNVNLLGTTTAQIQATINVENIEMQTFKFVLLDENDNIIQNKSNNKKGVVTFDAIMFGEGDIGSKTYKVKQVIGNSQSVNYDDHVENIIINIETDDNSNLNSTVIYDSDNASFINKYKARGALSIISHKRINGYNNRDLNTKYTYLVYAKTAPISRIESGLGVPIYYEGEYYFVDLDSVEVQQYLEDNDLFILDSPILYESNDILYKDNENDSFIEYDGPIVHRDYKEYELLNGKYPALKILNDINPEKQYSITLEQYESCKESFTETCRNIINDRIYNFWTDYDYDNPSSNQAKLELEYAYGYIYKSGQLINDVITIKDNEGNDLVLDLNEPDDIIDFGLFQEYVYKVGIIESEIPKDYKALEDEQFSFELRDDKNILQTKSNNIKGKITFNDIEYTEADIGRTYEYTINEVNDGQEGFIYDSHIEKLIVNIEDNRDGTLKISVNDDNLIIFDNTYVGYNVEPSESLLPPKNETEKKDNIGKSNSKKEEKKNKDVKRSGTPNTVDRIIIDVELLTISMLVMGIMMMLIKRTK